MAKPKTSLLSKIGWGVGATVLTGILFPPAIPFVAGAAIAGIAGSEVYNAHKENTLNSTKKVGATATIGFAASLIAGAIFPPLGLVGLLATAAATAGVAIKEAGGPKQAWNKVKNFFKPSKSEPEAPLLKDVNTHKKEQQQEPKQQKPKPTEEQLRQAEAMRKQQEEQQAKQRNLTSDKPLNPSITEAFDTFKDEHHKENPAVKRSDNSMTFPDKDSAITLMKQQAQKGEKFLLGDKNKDFYVYSDGNGGFYEGNAEGLKEFQEKQQKTQELIDGLLEPIDTGKPGLFEEDQVDKTSGLSALPEHRDEVEPLAGIKISGNKT